ncbi:MAG: putative hydrolase of the HAD superfamily [Spirochaetes bacterium]|nr:MAG: putative hydrolase of the HAD superfamily [Spirochaetota bacterium]
MDIKAVGFDLDGTLYPGWRMYAVSAGMGLRHPRFFYAFGAARRALRKTLSDQNKGRKPQDSNLGSRDALLRFQSDFLATRLGIPPKEAARLIDARCYRGVEEKFSTLPPFPGVQKCLEALKSEGLALGLLSDLPPERKIERMGLKGYFSAILCSEDFGTLKPSSFPFLALASKLGAEPGKMVYVGNKVAYDMTGAKNIGMKTALLGASSHPSVDFCFKSWDALAQWILSL